jgi:type I restriction enzyme M protein
MDLRETGIPFEKKFIQFSEEDIAKITGTYHQWQTSPITNSPEFSYAATLDEIAKKDYSLVPSKYIEFVNKDENIDFDEKMLALKAEFTQILEEEQKSKLELLKVFKELGYEIKL